MSLTQNIQHIVFSTRERRATITPGHERELYHYIYSLLISRKCFVYRIGGMPDHLHILVDVHPSIALSDLVRDLKMAAGKWLRSKPEFPKFNGWSSRYAALSKSYKDVPTVTEYIKNQLEHHNNTSFEEEYQKLINCCGLVWHDNEL